MSIPIRTAALLATISFAAVCQEERLYVDPGMHKIAQVAIICKDIQASSQRWARMLGMKPGPIRITAPGHETHMIFRGKPSDGQVKLTFFDTGDAVLELLEPVGGDTSWREYLDEHGEGVQHIAFKVTDLEKTVKSLEQQGMPVLHRGRFDTNDGTYVYMDSKDKLGVIVELLHSDKQ